MVYGDRPQERSTFFRLEVYKTVRISRDEVKRKLHLGIIVWLTSIVVTLDVFPWMSF